MSSLDWSIIVPCVVGLLIGQAAERAIKAWWQRRKAARQPGSPTQVLKGYQHWLANNKTGQVRPFQPNPPCLVPERRYITETVTYPDGYKQEVTYPVGQRPEGVPPGVQWAEPDGIAMQLLHARPGQSASTRASRCNRKGWSQEMGIVHCSAEAGHQGDHANQFSSPWVDFDGSVWDQWKR